MFLKGPNSLNKLGRFEGLESFSRDSGETKLWGLVASFKFKERERETQRRGVRGGLAPPR